MIKRCSFLILAATAIFVSCDKKEIKENRLALATSPYLREHADNPVDWYEWGDEALEKAKKENKPIIISIGYASCHWCHVMESETFMDTAVARMMNENFVSIKVDREERPDIDQIYINASQLLTGHAGWPLNAFALPNTKPFYAGTYFTKDQWLNLLSQVIGVYKNENETLIKQADQVTQGVAEADTFAPVTDDQNINLQKTYEEIIPNWKQYFDPVKGGLIGAPKFPMPVIWEFLLEDYHQTKDEELLKIVTTTLDQMHRGGIYDQLAGGFARYSTDADWKVPHFEKMLYDNGQLVSLYAHAFQVTQKKEYEAVLKETLEFISKSMTSPEGGFYSSLNADSEGEEGKFYAWTKSEIKKTLDERSASVCVDLFNLTEYGNWEKGKNVLYRSKSIQEVASDNSLTETQVKDIYNQIKQTLLVERNKRIAPSLDDKILTSWNAIMMMGYVDAYWALGNSEYLNTAIKNAQFIKQNMLQQDGKLLRSFSNGKSGIDAFLDDYAFLSLAYIKLYQATFDLQWLTASKTIADYAVKHFHDTASGLFFYTSNESAQLIAKKIEIPDQVIPSSNSVMAEVLFALNLYFENGEYRAISHNMINQMIGQVKDNGPYYAQWASVMGKMINEPFEVAIMGEDAGKQSQAIMKNYFPNILLMGGVEENLPLLENKRVDGKTIIYVCRNKVCKLPVQEVAQAIEQLNAK